MGCAAVGRWDESACLLFVARACRWRKIGIQDSYGDKGKADDEWPDVDAEKIVAGRRDCLIASRPLIKSPSASVLRRRSEGK